jgi:shikimate kinase
VMHPENRELLRELGFVVWLTASEEVIFERVSRNKKRPLLHTDDPRATIHELLERRRPLYEGAAQFTLDSSHLAHEAAADTLIAEARRAFSWQSVA